MARFRSWLACLTAVLLLLSSVPARAAAEPDSSQGGQTLSSASAETSFFRIKNKWQGNYLYEGTDGIVHYGRTAVDDQSSEWSLVAAGGNKLIINRATGHAITIASTAKRRDALTAVVPSAVNTPAEQWKIEPASRAGYVVIKSATVSSSANLVIHEEDQLGFAEASNDINISFESPQWRFEPVIEGTPVLLVNEFREDQFLYETTNPDKGRPNDIVAYAKGDPTDSSAQWYLETQSGQNGEPATTRIRNRATGNYIQQFDEDNKWRAIELAAGAATDDSFQWKITPATNDQGQPVEGYSTIASAGKASYVLNTQFPTDIYARSNDWSKPELSNAHWKIVAAYPVKPVRIVNFTLEKSGSDYLYEDDTGEVKSSVLDATYPGNPHYQWLVEDFDGSKRLRNLSTGHYIVSGAPLQSADMSVSSATYLWKLDASDQYDDYITIQSVADATAYVHLDNGKVQSGATDPLADTTQWLLEDPTAKNDGTPQYVRIRNQWQPFVWYEDANGDLKYGNARSDQRDQWLIEKFEGRKRIQNRATGDYVNLQDMRNGHIRVTTVDDSWKSAVWIIETDSSGTKLIYNVNDKPQDKKQVVRKLINLQNLTKFAEYANINRNWGSPKWSFELVSDDSSPANVRLVTKDGDVLYESTDAVDGHADTWKVLHGKLPENDKRAIWFLEDAGGGIKRIKNVNSGHYIVMENMADHETEVAPDLPLATMKTIYDTWGSAKWIFDKAGDYSAIRSGWAEHYIYTKPGQGVQVKKVTPAGAYDDSVLFHVDAVTSRPALPEGNIRIKNSFNNQYLYENKAGVVFYGNVGKDNGYSHWTLETAGGVTRIKNRATGHYASLTGDYRYLIGKAGVLASEASAQWAVEPSSDGAKWLIRSLNAGNDDEYVYINTDKIAVYAERGLYPVNNSSSQWLFEAAPDAFVTSDSDGLTNVYTSTPVFDDSNSVTIGSSGKLLTESNGSVQLAVYESGNSNSIWLMQDFNGRLLLKNRGTGHLLALSDSGSVGTVPADDAILPSSQWKTEETQGLITLSNASNPSGSILHRDLAVSYGAAATASDARWTVTAVPGDVRYAAVSAFMGAGNTASDDTLSFTVNAQSAGTYTAVIHYFNKENAAVNQKLLVNGLAASEQVTFPSSNDWTDLSVNLSLRSGINQVTLQGDGQEVNLGVESLTLKNSIAPASRGATTPYITYEAEQADTNATLLSPSRKYLDDEATEASGRQAVKLTKTGDYVSFTLAKDANSIVVRYSIPDSADGKGKEETLGLYVNGEFRQKLTLTSKYAWEYGSYPWSNDPKQGSGHRFFDEVHALIGDVPAGATVRLVKDADSLADYYTVDLADFEQVAPSLAMPDGFVSVTDYGATADDGIDDTAAFKQAVTAAKAAHKGVWFPAGTFELGDGLLNLDDITIRGAGMWYTTLNGAKFVGRGANIQVYDLLIDGNINERDDEAITNAFHGGFGPGSVIQNVWIEHSKAGLWLTKVKDGEEYTDGLHMVGMRIRDLMADGINFSVGTSNSMMEQSTIRYPGDDGIAMWSTDGRASVNNTARFNTVDLPWLADNIVVFGGTDNKIQDNIARDTITNGAGIAVSTRFNPIPFAGTTIVERNTLIRTGSYDTGLGTNLGALWIFADTKDLDGNVIIRDNTALDSTYQGVTVNGIQKIDNMKIQNLVVDGAGTYGFNVASGVSGNIGVDNVIIRNARVADVANASSLSLNETGEGFASSMPFLASFASGASGTLALQAGSSSGLKITDRTGKDITASSSFTSRNPSVAQVDEKGNVIGKSVGKTLIEVVNGGTKRLFSLAVTNYSGGSTGGTTTGGTAGSQADNDRALAAASGSAEILFDVSKTKGEASFSASALLKAAVAQPNGFVIIRNGTASYRFPLALAAKLIDDRKLTDPAAAVWTFSVLPADDTTAQKLVRQASAQGLRLTGTPMDFHITLQQGGKLESIGSFGSTYVDRSLQVEGSLSPKTATALVYDEKSGTFLYVPALFETANGTTKVTIRSTGNSWYAVADHPVSFADITKHWAKEEIGQLASKLIVKGRTETSFAPNLSITRAEYAALLVRGLGLRDPGGSTGFTDVAASAWYAQDVRTASHFGLIQGSGGLFRPLDTVTREEIAVMSARALALVKAQSSAAAASSAATSFLDEKSISSWALTAIHQLADQGIMLGNPGGDFAPGKTATRAEAAVILSRVLLAGKLMNS